MLIKLNRLLIKHQFRLPSPNLLKNNVLGQQFFLSRCLSNSLTGKFHTKSISYSENLAQNKTSKDFVEQLDLKTKNNDKCLINPQLRPPVVTIMGHVDHGKTTLLDSLRAIRSVDNEFGGITQHLAGFNLDLKNCSEILNSERLKSLKTKHNSITFIDTPGHAAFYNLRMRGASITDLVILIVAADDGVMPQTVESIKCAQRHECPIIVAVNKIDKPDVDTQLVLADLAAHDILVEQLGGTIQCVEISALKKKNLDHLLEAILLQAEFKEKDLIVDHGSRMEGVILESRTERGIGKIATCLITRGRLQKAALRGPLVAGLSYCKPKVFLDDNSIRIPNIETSSMNNPGFLLEIAGWTELPKPGDVIAELNSENEANELLKSRKKKANEEKLKLDSHVQTLIKDQAKSLKPVEEPTKGRRRKKRSHSSLILDDVKLEANSLSTEDDLSVCESQDPRPNVKIILRSDVEGSRESIINMFATMPRNEVKLDMVSSGVGPLTMTDVDNAISFNAVVILFNTKIEESHREKLEKSKIKVLEHNVVYHLAESIKQHIVDLIPVSLEPERIGLAHVKQIFDMKVKKNRIYVVGCKCHEGSLVHEASAKLSYEQQKDKIYFRIYRRNNPEDTSLLPEVTDKILASDFYFHKDGLLMKSLKHKTTPVDKINENTECGMILGEFRNGNLEDYTDVKENDVIECYRLVETQRDLDWQVDF